MDARILSLHVAHARLCEEIRAVRSLFVNAPDGTSDLDALTTACENVETEIVALSTSGFPVETAENERRRAVALASAESAPVVS